MGSNSSSLNTLTFPLLFPFASFCGEPTARTTLSSLVTDIAVAIPKVSPDDSPSILDPIRSQDPLLFWKTLICPLSLPLSELLGAPTNK